MGVQWMTGGTYTWTGHHPDVGAERKRRCRLGFTDDFLVIANRGFNLPILLASMTSVHYEPGYKATLRFTADGGIDITLRESGKMRLGSVVLYRIQAAIP